VRRVTQREEAWTWRDIVKRVEGMLNVKLAEVQGRGRTKNRCLACELHITGDSCSYHASVGCEN